jgi:hypothetical protein
MTNVLAVAFFTNPSATDGRCHNAQHGTFNHECGKTAAWLAVRPSEYTDNPVPGMYASGFCDQCRRHGDERHGVLHWLPL